MTMTIEWVDNLAALAEVAGAVGPGPVAFDSEADSLHRYREKQCLFQLSFNGRDVLVDALELEHVDPLRSILETASIRKVVHGGDYDVRLLARDHGIAPRGLFDTMIAARLCGERTFGLGALLEKHLGVRLDKRLQRADWSRRPLSDEMIAYAAEDTRHLLPLSEILESRLDELGRTAWAREEFSRVEEARWSGARSDDPEPFRRVKGAASLDRRGLAVLLALWSWRDEQARRLDRPLFRVLRDEAMIAIARRRPEDARALAGISGVGPRLARSMSGAALLDAVRRGLGVPDDALPEVVRSRRPPPDVAFEGRVARLRARRDAVAEALGIDGSLIAGRPLLEAVVRRCDAGEDPAGLPDLRPWQWTLLRDDA